MPSLQAPMTKKGLRKHSKDVVDTVENLERLERRWNQKKREDKVEVYTKFLNYKLENTRQRQEGYLQ